MNEFSNKSKKIWLDLWVHFRCSDLFPLLNRKSGACLVFVHIKHGELAQKLYPDGFAYELQKDRTNDTEERQRARARGSKRWKKAKTCILYDYRCEYVHLFGIGWAEIWALGENSCTSKPCAHVGRKIRKRDANVLKRTSNGCPIRWTQRMPSNLKMGLFVFSFALTHENTRCANCTETPYPKINRIYGLWCIHLFISLGFRVFSFAFFEFRDNLI